MRIHAAGAILDGVLTVPHAVAGLVLFTQHSPRDRAVAAALHDRNLATLLIEPLTADERADEAHRFDIDLVADRVIGTLRWLRAQPVTEHLPIGLFAAGVNAGAALVAAASRPGHVQTVVTRGGRVDLAGGALAQLQAPTLLIVGERDARLREINEEARAVMRARGDMCVIPDADRYFRGPRALDQVILQAADWFTLHLAAPVPEHAPTVDSALPVEQTGLTDVFMPPTPTHHRREDDR
jgi:putative phosphoribosyl transferase